MSEKKYIDKITVQDIQVIVHILKGFSKDYSNTYINHILEIVSKMYNYAIDMNYIDKNPTKKIKKLKEREGIQYIKNEEFRKLYEVIERLLFSILFDNTDVHWY